MALNRVRGGRQGGTWPLAEEPGSAAQPLSRFGSHSLYENNIGDAGAEHVAEVLPQMCALRVLE